MIPFIRSVAVGVALVFSICGPAFAQSTASPAPSAPSSSIPFLRIRGFGQAGYLWLLADESFEAVLGSAGAPIYGGGAEARFQNGLFFLVSALRVREAGERVFAFDGEIFRLGIPATISITPIELAGGYRRGRLWRFVPYGGLGIGVVRYRERSEFASDAENISESFASYLAFGGGELALSRWIASAFELQFRHVPKALGDNGISEFFGEENLGGMTLVAKVLVGR